MEILENNVIVGLKFLKGVQVISKLYLYLAFSKYQKPLAFAMWFTKINTCPSSSHCPPSQEVSNL